MNERSEQIERIRRNEEILDELTAAVSEAERALERLEALRGKVKELKAYYSGGDWSADYEDDERGLLPGDLKRGVLSEDDVWDALDAYDALTAKR